MTRSDGSNSKKNLDSHQVAKLTLTSPRPSNRVGGKPSSHLTAIISRDLGGSRQEEERRCEQSLCERAGDLPAAPPTTTPPSSSLAPFNCALPKPANPPGHQHRTPRSSAYRFFHLDSPHIHTCLPIMGSGSSKPEASAGSKHLFQG